MTDFNTNAVRGTLEIGDAPNFVDTPVPIIDDLINEPREEGFILYLTVDPASSVDLSLVIITRTFSLGVIDENDGEYYT